MSKRKAKRPDLRIVGRHAKPGREHRRQVLEAQQVEIPGGEKTVLKVVPATINGQSIGEAIIYDDRTTDIKISPDADPELIAILRGEINDFNTENDMHLQGRDLGLDI
jgi:hypothetical protein